MSAIENFFTWLMIVSVCAVLESETSQTGPAKTGPAGPLAMAVFSVPVAFFCDQQPSSVTVLVTEEGWWKVVEAFGFKKERLVKVLSYVH